MRASLPFLLALPASLGGCAAIQFAPPLVAAMEDSARQRQRYAGGGFEPAAQEACRGRAARHGRVEITTVEPHGSNSMRVYGTIDRFGGSPGRSFACVFRRDGNMTYFRVS